MNEERIKKLVEEKIDILSKLIEEAQKAIPVYRHNIDKELDNICFEITEILGDCLICLQKYEKDIDMEPLERAKEIQKVLRQYILLGEQSLHESKQKKSKLFISHATEDAAYVSELVQLFEYLGFNKETMFCSSYSGFGIPLDEDIYDYLKKQFDEHELYIIFVLSNNYYHSPACLNEMGAAWVLSAKQTAILLPDFTFREIKGAINPNKISIKMDQQDSYDLKHKLGELRKKLLGEFELKSGDVEQWERKRDHFIFRIQEVKTNKKDNSTVKKKRRWYWKKH